VPDDEAGGDAQPTAFTARAAVLVLAVAAVIVAVAVPMKIWLGQRSDLSSLAAQTRSTQQRVAQLKAQDKQWQQPSYIETQARNRLHYVLPGQKTYIVLGRASHRGSAGSAKHTAAAATGPWYSQFWESVQIAGKAPTATR
jgi:cell division protein FtsB